ncbi:MAG: hypothetical protein ACI9IA_000823, partial [Enterobacterales bacterium]
MQVFVFIVLFLISLYFWFNFHASVREVYNFSYKNNLAIFGSKYQNI